MSDTKKVKVIVQFSGGKDSLATLIWAVEKYPNRTFIFVGYKVIAEIEKPFIWFRYFDFWKIFSEENDWNHNETQSFLNGMVEQHFKMKGLTPTTGELSPLTGVEQHFKSKK